MFANFSSGLGNLILGSRQHGDIASLPRKGQCNPFADSTSSARDQGRFAFQEHGTSPPDGTT
jgi:hypothetical protein